MSIVTGKKIEQFVRDGIIEIDGYDKRNLNTNSYDLCLGDYYIEYSGDSLYDVKDKDAFKEELKEIPDSGIILNPGRFYLMHTKERIHSKQCVPILDGKSSIARIGVKVHFTAGYGDVGFDGQFTLEVESALRVRVYKGMRFCQVRFQTVTGEISDYKTNGNYVDSKAKGPVESRVYYQLLRDGLVKDD